MIRQGPFNNWCALCGSHALHFKEGVTRYKTLLEAAPALAATMADNMASRAALEAAGLTYEKRKRN